ncbi:MAG: DUF2459 domain-containing protein [Pseudomonadota bacterium]|nr:DUF2459 domain-containing protein [Pseudomonadota bacterium]
MERHFVLDRSRRTILLRGRGYGPDDVFYEAHGRYSALKTSNQWTSDRRADAGVEIGAWTPFAQGIMWRFGSRTAHRPIPMGHDGPDGPPFRWEMRADAEPDPAQALTLT